MKILTFALILISLISITISKKKKKQKKEKKPENPLDRRPQSTSPELFCDACQAIIQEATKQLYNKKKESDVVDVLEYICNPEYYYKYSKKISVIF